MKVLQLIDSLQAGGAERVAVNLCNTLNGKIDQSFLCATRVEGVLKASINTQSNYFFLNKTHTLHLNAILRLKKIIKKNNISIIHAHGSSFFLATIMKIFVNNINIIWHDHNGNRNNTGVLNKAVIKICSLFFAQIITVNKALQSWSKKHLWCKKVVYMPNFVLNYKNNVSTKLEGINNMRILCLANLRTPKNHENLIKAFFIVHKEYPKWSLHCVGSIYNDEYSKNIQSLIINLKLQDYVFLYGSKPDVSCIIEQCNIGVLSSDIEGLPMALLEYGLGGLAVITTDVGECKEVILEHGLLVKSKDYIALSNAIITYIKNKDKRKEDSKNFNERINNKFSSSAIVSQIINNYKTL